MAERDGGHDPSADTCTIGLDYGTNSVRAVVVSCADGRTLGTYVFDYPSGERGVIVDPGDPHLARQNPADYVLGLRVAALGALADAEGATGSTPSDGRPAAGVGTSAEHPDFSRDRVVGIGVDTTGSTPIPVDAACRPLALDPAWRGNPAAHAWLWKDHTSAEEAANITRAAHAHAPEYLAPIGGTYSSEWFWSKVWHCLNVAPDVFAAAASWVELADFVPAVARRHLPTRASFFDACAPPGTRRCTRGPGAACLPRNSSRRLDPRLAELRDRLYDEAHPPHRPAGRALGALGRSNSVSAPGSRSPWAVSTPTTARWERGWRPALWSRSSGRPPATLRSRPTPRRSATFPAYAGSSTAPS